MQKFRQLLHFIEKSLIKKYLFFLAFTLVIPIIVIFKLVTNYAENLLEQDAIEKNVANTDVMVKRLDTEINDVILKMRLISDESVEEGLDINRMFQRSRQVITQSSIIQSMLFLNAESEVMFEAPFVPVADQSYYYASDFNQIQWSHYYAVSDLVYNRNAVPVVTVSLPIFSSDGQQFKGALIAELSMAYLSDVLRSARQTQARFAFITDRSGEMIASTTGSTNGSSPSFYKPSYSIGHMKALYNQEPSIVAYQTMRDGWTLYYGVPERVAFAPLYKLSLFLTIGFSVIILFVLFFSWMGMRSMIYPIIRLTELAKRYQSQHPYNNEPPQLLPATKDEIGILTRTLVLLWKSLFNQQKVLEGQERYLRDLIEAIPYSILTINEQGFITHVNKEFEKLTKYTRNYMQGLPLQRLEIKNHQEDYVLLNALDSDQPSLEQESYLLDSQGKKHIVRITTSKFINQKSGMTEIIAIIEDISQMKLLESRLRQSDKLALIGQITAGIAHEIKNPLMILSGSSELLIESLEDPQGTEDVKLLSRDIYSVTRKMTEITNNFLNFAKVHKKDRTPLFLHEVMDDVLHLVRMKLSESKVTVLKDYQENFLIKGFPDQLSQAFLNIILNALDAMPSGGNLNISIYRQAEYPEKAIVEIKDSGTGITSSDLEWLFDPFFSTKETGSGLGLTISKDIIEAHKGSIEIKSLPGEGTTMRCFFIAD